MLRKRQPSPSGGVKQTFDRGSGSSRSQPLAHVCGVDAVHVHDLPFGALSGSDADVAGRHTEQLRKRAHERCIRRALDGRCGDRHDEGALAYLDDPGARGTGLHLYGEAYALGPNTHTERLQIAPALVIANGTAHLGITAVVAPAAGRYASRV
jgi:hypothetical protein